MPIQIPTRLKNGTPVLLRPLQSDDEARLREGIARLSDRSRYYRFFTGARHLPDHVVRRLVDVDGDQHIAWGGLDMEVEGGPAAIGAAHAIREGDGPEAEIAFGILDAYHGQGLARMLIAAVIRDSLEHGITVLRADILSENRGAQRLIRHIGGRFTRADGPVTGYRLDCADAEERLRALPQPEGLREVYAVLDARRPQAA